MTTKATRRVIRAARNLLDILQTERPTAHAEYEMRCALDNWTDRQTQRRRIQSRRSLRHKLRRLLQRAHSHLLRITDAAPRHPDPELAWVCINPQHQKVVTRGAVARTKKMWALVYKLEDRAMERDQTLQDLQVERDTLRRCQQQVLSIVNEQLAHLEHNPFGAVMGTLAREKDNSRNKHEQCGGGGVRVPK